MGQYFNIHPDNPQPRLIRQAVDIIRQGGVIVYPTDSSYALGCELGQKQAMEKISRIRQLDSKHNFTLVCRDLSEISLYGKIDNATYRLLKSHTPGPYTFIMKATREVPKRLQNAKRKTIGLRIPDNQICRELLTELNAPLMSSTLIMPDETLPMSDPEDIRAELIKQVDLIIDGGHCGLEPTTVIALEDGQMDVLRQGKGGTDVFDL